MGFIDIGYTLVNEDDALEHRLLRLHAALKHSGVSVSREDFGTLLQEAIAKQVPQPASQAIAKLTDSEELRNRLMAELAWRDGLERPYPEAKRVLDALGKRYRIGIIANQSPGPRRG